ncbi:MAG: YhfC family glutamic-type intramembrane protease, partial [Clostridiaceae bacterium]
YGIGHGGIEMVLIGGLSYFNSVALALAINSGTLNALVKGQDTSVIENLKNSVMNVTSQIIVIGIAERVFAFVIQMALTFVVLYGIRKRKNIYLLAAILLHGLVDLGAGFYQTKIISNIFMIEGIVFIFAVIALAFIFKSKKIFNTL